MSILRKIALLSDITSNIYTNFQRLIKGNTLKARLLNMVNSSIIRVIDTAANFTSNNPILADGEIGIESDSLTTSPKFKIGNGITAWNSLPYSSSLTDYEQTFTVTSGTITFIPAPVGKIMVFNESGQRWFEGIDYSYDGIDTITFLYTFDSQKITTNFKA